MTVCKINGPSYRKNKKRNVTGKNGLTHTAVEMFTTATFHVSFHHFKLTSSHLASVLIR